MTPVPISSKPVFPPPYLLLLLCTLLLCVHATFAFREAVTPREMVVNNYTSSKKLERWVSWARVLQVLDFMFRASARISLILVKIKWPSATIKSIKKRFDGFELVKMITEIFRRTIWSGTVLCVSRLECEMSLLSLRSPTEWLQNRQKTLWESKTLSTTLSEVSTWTPIIARLQLIAQQQRKPARRENHSIQNMTEVKVQPLFMIE